MKKTRLVANVKLDIRYKKILYQATHRGTKELDLIMKGFLKKNFYKLSLKEIEELEQILTWSDPKLYEYLIMQKIFNSEKSILKKIKKYIAESI